MKGIELKARREAAGLSQKDLAARCRVSDRTVSRWENDREPLQGMAETVILLIFALEDLARGSHNTATKDEPLPKAATKRSPKLAKRRQS
jgi:transcriptional regulator with XRE-family HTH domain